MRDPNKDICLALDKHMGTTVCIVEVIHNKVSEGFPL